MEGDNELVDSVWKKVQRDSEKLGLREGRADGQDRVFQKSFDEGYKSGFANGFQLGQLKAKLTLKRVPFDEEETLRKTGRGKCMLCKDMDGFRGTTFGAIAEKQMADSERFIEVWSRSAAGS